MCGIKSPHDNKMKKDINLLQQIKPELSDLLHKRGWTDAQFEQLWSDMLAFASYSFNKCFTGDTVLYGATITIESMYERYIDTPRPLNLVADSMFDDGTIRHNQIVDINYRGIRPVYRLITATGAQIDATLNHKFPTPEGEKWLCDLYPGDPVYVADGDRVKIDSVKVVSFLCYNKVYDIEMADPAHNFITDSGLVTSNSHSQAYAIIGFLTAKQKAYHPAEFFAGLCNSYLGQSSYVKDDADEIISDMLRMGVKLAPFDFRQDHRRCWVNSAGQLEYAIPLIRDCSDGVAQYLYEIRDNQYDKFWKLVFDVNNSCINQSQIEILIQLGFFNEFGPGRKLWQIFAVCQFLKFGAAKKIAKDKIDAGQFLYPIVERHSKGVNDKGVELKGFQITDMEAILNEAEESIMTSECEDFSFQERIKAQQHYLGFISMNTGKEEDRRYVYVKAVRPAFAKKTGRQFGTHVITRSIGSGKESLLTIMSKDWKDEVVAGDILYLDHWTRTDRGYFNLDKYRVVL